jgi:hypothetical protein
MALTRAGNKATDTTDRRYLPAAPEVGRPSRDGTVAARAGLLAQLVRGVEPDGIDEAGAGPPPAILANLGSELGDERLEGELGAARPADLPARPLDLLLPETSR